MKKQVKKPKPMFRNRKPLTDKTKLVAIIGLLIALIVFIALPYILWNVPIEKAIVWGLVLVVLIDGLVYVLFFNMYVKAENEKTKEHEKYVKAYKSQKAEKEHLQSRVNSFDRDIQNERNKRDNAIRERDEITKENDKLQSYKQTLKEMYLCSQMPDVRAYAEECLKREDCLDLFQPMRYIRDQNYARVIEANAEILLELIRKPSKWGISNASDVRKKLNELLKKGSTGVAGVGGSQVLTRERQTLKKIDNDMER